MLFYIRKNVKMFYQEMNYHSREKKSGSLGPVSDTNPGLIILISRADH